MLFAHKTCLEMLNGVLGAELNQPNGANSHFNLSIAAD